MNYYDDIMKRTEVYQIANFTMYGNLSNRSKEEFEKAEEDAYFKLNQELEKYLDEKKIDDLESVITGYSAAVADFYFALGMKVGAKMVTKLIT